MITLSRGCGNEMSSSRARRNKASGEPHKDLDTAAHRRKLERAQSQKVDVYHKQGMRAEDCLGQAVCKDPGIPSELLCIPNSVRAPILRNSHLGS